MNFTTLDIVTVLVFRLKHLAYQINIDQLKSCRLRAGQKNEFALLAQRGGLCYCLASTTGLEEVRQQHVQEEIDKLAQIKLGKFPTPNPRINTPELAKQVWENATQIPVPDWYLANFTPITPKQAVTENSIVETDPDIDTPLVKNERYSAKFVSENSAFRSEVSDEFRAESARLRQLEASKPVLGFRDTVFTNMYPCTIEIQHKKLGLLKFSCVESAYVACKCGRMQDIKQFQYMNGYKAKRVGGKHGTLVVRADWDDIKLQVMGRLLRIKFQIPELRAALLNTGSGYIEETNNWHDSFWGRCNCPKCKGIEWHNNLGKLLMEIRAELQEVN